MSNSQRPTPISLPFKLPPPSKSPLESYLDRRCHPAAVEDVKRRIIESVDGFRCSKKHFPGPLPATVSRSVLQVLSKELYWITEKSDGERYMLLISREGVFLINRKFFVIKVKSSVYIDIYQNSLPVLLDGEVMDLEGSHAMYLAYDCLLLGNGNLTGRTFSTRLQAIESLVKRYDEYAANLPPPLDFPFMIASKLFVQQFEVDRIFSKIHHHARKGWVYIDTGRRRYNKNDGLILVADRDSYVPERKTSLLKWKWPNKNTIDFRLRKPFLRNNGELELLCGGYGKEDQEICARRFLPTGNMVEQLEEWSTGLNSVIVECFYDAATGLWKFCNHRPDKHKPNHILTVIQTMESLIDNVTKDDMRKACKRYHELDKSVL